MDKRWKAVERSVAAKLTDVLSDVGNLKFERIPLLGRDGPDLTINSSGLVINVKSRKGIPQRLLPRHAHLIQIGDLVCFRLDNIIGAGGFQATGTEKPWKQLQDWYDWMDDWTQRQPDKDRLISCIILHRPRLPVGKSGIVIHSSHLKRLAWTPTTKFN